MCLILTAKQCVPRIAEEDILCDKVVYKPRLKDFLISPYRGYIYLNVKYHVSVTLTAKAKWGSIIIPAIIPKGTVYYTDGCDIVAEKMIIYNPFTIRN